MPTFSTAFGSLPSYNDMLGRNNTTAGGLDQYNQSTDDEPPKKKRPPIGAGQQPQAPPPTFAELSRSGRARPAPPAPGVVPGAAPGAPGSQAAPPPPMLGALGTQLQQPWPEEANLELPPEEGAGPAPAAPTLRGRPGAPSDAGGSAAPPPPTAQGLPVDAGGGANTPPAPPPPTAPPTDPNAPPGPPPFYGAEWGGPDVGWVWPYGPMSGDYLNDPEKTDAFIESQKQGGGRNVSNSPASNPANDLPSRLQSIMMDGAGGSTNGMNGPSGGSGFADSIMNQLMRQLSILQADPSGMSDADFATRRKASEDNLTAEYMAEKQKLDEEMARRGIYSSSIASGRMGDLAGQQARALATMNADLLKEKAALTSAGRGQLISGLQGAAGTQSEREMRAMELVQEAKLKGIELDLTQARDMANREYQQGQLANERFSITQQGQIAKANLEEQRATRLQNLGISSRELDLKAQDLQQQAWYQGRTLSLQEARDKAEVEFRTKQLMLENDRLTWEQANAQANRDFQRETQTTQNTWEAGQQEKQNTFTAGQSQLDRDLRAKLSGDELTFQGKQLDANQFSTTMNFLAQIIPNLGALSDTQLQDILKKFGISWTPRGGSGIVNNSPPPNPGGGGNPGGFGEGDN
jgi:hypothetical protein